MALSAFSQGIVVSAILLGAIIGAAVIGSLSDKYGRKTMVLLSAIIFALWSVSSALAGNVK
jgi:MFS family permease